AVEIGCGKGDFLALLVERTGMSGLGLDPAFAPGPLVRGRPDLRFEPVAFEAGRDLSSFDLVISRHTLEHLPHPAEFFGMIRSSMRPSSGAVLMIEVPESMRIFRDRAF